MPKSEHLSTLLNVESNSRSPNAIAFVTVGGREAGVPSFHSNLSDCQPRRRLWRNGPAKAGGCPAEVCKTISVPSRIEHSQLHRRAWGIRGWDTTQDAHLLSLSALDRVLVQDDMNVDRVVWKPIRGGPHPFPHHQSRVKESRWVGDDTHTTPRPSTVVWVRHPNPLRTGSSPREEWMGCRGGNGRGRCCRGRGSHYQRQIDATCTGSPQSGHQSGPQCQDCKTDANGGKRLTELSHLVTSLRAMQAKTAPLCV